MKHGTPFRAAMMMAASLAAIQREFAGNFAMLQAGISSLGPYEGRGKGRTARHDGGGTARAKRAALKARNVKRHKAHCKG